VKPLALTSIAVLSVCLIGFLDHRTGHEISLSIFFLIPISLIVISVNFWAGVLTAVISSIIWYYNDITTGIKTSHWLIPVWNAVMRMGYFILHSFFLSRYMSQIRLNRKLACTDPLTGAFNSRYLKEKINEFSEGTNKKPRHLSVIFFDMDNFKQVNDERGHAEGDQLLITFVRIAQQHIPESGFLARIGGDEFALILDGKDSTKTREIVAMIMHEAAASFAHHAWPASLSAGAVTGSTKTGYAKLSQLADHLLYRAKKAGKNHAVYDELPEPLP
jgi:diguanylate cyclase (GGDEF)-like protein